MIIADLHIHSRFSRACSKQINIGNLEKYARIKGVNLLGTGDFQHPLWNKEIKEELEEDENGILWTKNKFPFLWQTEISLMYTQSGRGRRVHHVILAPNKGVVDQIIDAFSKKGRLDYDGRPIFGFSSVELVEMMMGISKDVEIIPAHAWTSWFGCLGSKSGFDSIEECFQEKSKHIHAIETGMSSDPAMNWRLSILDKYSLVSFSDMHSFWPWRISREAVCLDLKKLTYKSVINAIRTQSGLSQTIETPPAYGKYHFDGHRNCNVCLTSDQTKKLNGICPNCGSPLTIGVMYRVEQLADRPEGYKPKHRPPFNSLIPLSELIAAVYGINQLYSSKVNEIHAILIKHFGNEFNVLLNTSADELKKVTGEKLVDVIIKNREGSLKIREGYDGVYGKIALDENKGEKKEYKKVQKSLSDF